MEVIKLAGYILQEKLEIAKRYLVPRQLKAHGVNKNQVVDLLGRPLFTDEALYKTPRPGVVTGLAWTSMGGDTLYIEAANVRTGKPGFKQTGQPGDVMVESSEIAYNHVRSLLDDDEKKTIAARRAKIRNLVFPEENRKEFEELPEHIRKGLKPRFVRTFPEVVEACFGKDARKRRYAQDGGTRRCPRVGSNPHTRRN